MAKKSENKTPKAAKPEAPKPEADNKEPVVETPQPVEAAWDIETWAGVAKARIGVETHTLRGAVCFLPEKDRFTETEIRTAVASFLNARVQK